MTRGSHFDSRTTFLRRNVGLVTFQSMNKSGIIKSVFVPEISCFLVYIYIYFFLHSKNWNFSKIFILNNKFGHSLKEINETDLVWNFTRKTCR